ncbi:MAG: hypothetical protein AAF390_05600 [Pseudomonadota bacterium]
MIRHLPLALVLALSGCGVEGPPIAPRDVPLDDPVVAEPIDPVDPEGTDDVLGFPNSSILVSGSAVGGVRTRN